MPADIVLGLQYGDEGKGKIVDYLAEKYNYVVRYHGGNNAGHTLVVNGHRTAVHALPSGVLHPHVNNVIGNGCVIDPIQLAKEITEHGGHTSLQHRLFVSHKAHIIVPEHKETDQATGSKVGTTGRGIGPTYAAKMYRTGLRMEDLDKLTNLYSSDVINLIKPFIADTTYLLQMAVKANSEILLEGAQGTMLDVDHGTYPYVTSSSCTVGGALTGTGLNHKAIRKVIGVTKAYTTRVGEGPFPTELTNEVGEKLRKIGNEYGTTTGRNRRCGWLNISELREACNLNGVDSLVITKLDVLDSFEKIGVGTQFPNSISISDFNGWMSSTKQVKTYSELPLNAKRYIESIEKITNTQISYISTSPERKDIIAL